MKAVAEDQTAQAKVGRDFTTFELGCKLQVAVDEKSELPIAAPAVFEVQPSPTLLRGLKVVGELVTLWIG